MRTDPHPLLACVADVHIGNHKAEGGEIVNGINERCRISLAAFRASVREAVDREAACFAVAGDLFHTRRPEPAVIAAVQKILEEEAGELPVLLIPGNHDMLDATAEGGNTAMAPLQHLATVIDKPTRTVFRNGLTVLSIPFSAEKSMTDHLSEVLGETAQHGTDEGSVLITHVGVYDDRSPPWCAAARDAIHANKLFELMAAASITYAFVGNFHNGQVWTKEGMTIVQIGTLCPGGYGDAGTFPKVGGMAFYSDGSHELTEVPGPRFFDHDLFQATYVDSDAGMRHFYRPVGHGKEQADDKTALPQQQDAMGAIGEYVEALKATPLERLEVLEAVRGYWSRA